MYFEKRYLQFNELVFDGYDMISDYDETLQFKGSSTAYSYGHGSYMPFKNEYLYVSERPVNMTILLKLKKLPCEYREDYVRFAIQELSKPGRLWAIRGNEILWAFARVNNMRPVNNGKPDRVEYDVEFIVPGGVWHKADKQKTFLIPYNLCSFMECKRQEGYNPVATSSGNEGTCEACESNKILMEQIDRCDCCCDDLKAEMALGFHLEELQQFYSCDTPYQFVYSCETASKFNKNPAFGQRICVDDICNDSIISGQFFSDTDIPTENIKLTIIGKAVNPRIRINGNENVIEGSYDGTLIIEPSGDIYYQENKCCEPTLLDPEVWIRPEGNKYGWVVYPQKNGIVINTNVCCGVNCVYIDHAAITI